MQPFFFLIFIAESQTVCEITSTCFSCLQGNSALCSTSKQTEFSVRDISAGGSKEAPKVVEEGEISAEGEVLERIMHS